MDVHNRRYLLEIRRKLRADSTLVEEVLWQVIRNRKLGGLKFKRQHSIGNYVVDFYCAEKRLIVELDGEYHNSPNQRKKDMLRDQNLKEMNFRVLRIANKEVIYDLEKVKTLLLSYLTPDPSP